MCVDWLGNAPRAVLPELEEVGTGDETDEVVPEVDFLDKIPPAVPPAMAARRTKTKSTRESQNVVLLNRRSCGASECSHHRRARQSSYIAVDPSKDGPLGVVARQVRVWE